MRLAVRCRNDKKTTEVFTKLRDSVSRPVKQFFGCPHLPTAGMVHTQLTADLNAREYPLLANRNRLPQGSFRFFFFANLPQSLGQLGVGVHHSL